MIKFTKQIEIRMSKGCSLYNTFVCHDGIYAATIPCEEKLADEIAKRINMHDELVKSLHNMVEVVGGNFCQNMEIKRKYKIARELLERCE